jgi:hypothetical protein
MAAIFGDFVTTLMMEMDLVASRWDRACQRGPLGRRHAQRALAAEFCASSTTSTFGSTTRRTCQHAIELDPRYITR